jgi:hypothetical protein
MLSFKVFQNSLKILQKYPVANTITSRLYRRLILQRFPNKVNEQPYLRPTVGDKIHTTNPRQNLH